MARATLTPKVLADLLVDPTPDAGSLDASPAAADTTNFNQFVSTGKDLLHVRNVNSGSTAHTVTVTSVPDQYGRTADMVYSVAAGAELLIPIPSIGYKQPNGMIYLQGDNAELKLTVYRNK